MRFTCPVCGDEHDGPAGLGASAPLYYYSVPEAERPARCTLDDNFCVVDNQFYFIRGCLDVPVHGESGPFVWGVWVSLSKQSFSSVRSLADEMHRSQHGPFFGWLSAALRGYPDTENLKTRVHLRDHGLRPSVELEPTDHPLAVEQRLGISRERVGEILSASFHA